MANGVALRDAKKESMWRRHVREQARGGLPVRAYCSAHELREYSFYWWRAELARRDAEPSPAFVPVTVAAQTPASTGEGRIEIVLAGDGRGRRVQVVGSGYWIVHSKSLEKSAELLTPAAVKGENTGFKS